MCGRFTLTTDGEQLQWRFGIEQASVPALVPRYNIAPMQMVAAVIHDGEKNRLGELRWGLVPSWAKDDKIGSKMINARRETLMEKPAFRNLIARKRCIIPADSFYEWKMHQGQKQPMRIVMKDRSLFAMAGLYDTWIAPDGRRISTCTIITTEPNALMKHIHNRMPAILEPEKEHVWLNRRNYNVLELMSFLRPYPDERMEAYPVSALVGNVRHDTPQCVEPVG